ncbi:MAG: hypothetical protein SFV17_21475 [Candidatus Obscuribacter sp.]|nr:hypothetical protein [Candidatus Obscuribacter sp.]
MSQYRENKLQEVRPGNTFANFNPNHESQEQVRNLLMALVEQLVANQEVIASERHPFADASLLFVYGAPGRGKTHLVEAFINELRLRAPNVYKRMVLSRGNFYFDYQIGDNPYYDAPIVVIDDMFHNKMSVSALHPATEIEAFMKFIGDLYDRRRLVLVTSNFSLIEGGIMQRVKEVDKVGRIVSRAAEVLSHCGEFRLEGPDYRQIIAANSNAGGISIKIGKS